VFATEVVVAETLRTPSNGLSAPRFYHSVALVNKVEGTKWKALSRGH
jgi:hypothetical protein